MRPSNKCEVPEPTNASTLTLSSVNCKNHSDIQAIDRCAGCAEPFCANCLVDLQGQKYCGACKVMALKGQPPPMVEEATEPCPEANEALKYAIIGIFCFGIILEPIAISKALKARKMIAMNPRLSGSGKATAALVIGCVGLVLWILGMISKFSNLREQQY